MKLRIRAFALAMGATFGLAIFVVTLLYLVLDYQSDTLIKLHKVLFAYKVTLLGSFIGLFWGFVYGSIGGSLFALLYNKFTTLFSDQKE
jgi:predicted small secreted protein